MIALSCPHCDARLKVKEDFAGKRVRCPHCQHTVDIPVAHQRSSVAEEATLPPQPVQSPLDDATLPPPPVRANAPVRLHKPSQSPQQAAGHVTASANSLGAILYEILTLSPPVGKGGDFLAILMRVTEGLIEQPEKRSPDRARKGLIPPELSAIALKALSKEPEDRYQTVEDLKHDIELFLEGRSVSTKQDSAWEMFKKLVKRNKGVSIATGVAAALLLTVVSYFLESSTKLTAREFWKKHDAGELK